MIDPERLIKGMLGGGGFGGKRMKKMMKKGMRGGMSGMGGIGFGTKAAVGMGVLGVALAATEHFLNKGGSGAQAAQPAQGYAPSSTPAAPTFPAGAPPTPSAPPPPPPGATASVPPPQGAAPASLPAEVDDDPRQMEGLLLLRAMIAAANADGMIDSEERSKILGQLDTMDVTPEERNLVGAELLSPLDAATLAGQTPREHAPQVYAAALLAIDVDTEVEQQFLDSLAHQLDLGPQTRQSIHDQLDPQEGDE